jgi:hypothetical protein
MYRIVRAVTSCFVKFLCFPSLCSVQVPFEAGSFSLSFFFFFFFWLIRRIREEHVGFHDNVAALTLAFK